MVGGIIAGKINMYDLQTRMAKHFKKELTFLLNNQMGKTQESKGGAAERALASH